MRFLPSGLILCGLLAACAPNRDETQLHVEPATARSGSAPLASMAGATDRNPRLASLPDRGELLAYDRTRPVRRHGAYTWHPVGLSEEHALRAIASGELVVTGLSGQQLRFRYQRHIEHADGNWTWIGRAAGERGGNDAILTFGEHAVFGTIPGGGKQLPLRLTVSDGHAWLIATDANAIARIDSSVTRPRRPDYLVPPTTGQGDMRMGAEASSAQALQALAASPGTTYIDLVLGYTTGFKNKWMSDTFCTSIGAAECERRRQSMAQSRLTSLVDLTNQIFVDSQVATTIRLLKAVHVSYPDKTSNAIALRELTGSGGAPPPAALLPLREARDRYGADLVSLVRKFETPQNEGCGIAWLLGSGGSQIDVSDVPYGYSVVSEGSDLDETDNFSYFCRDRTLAHELAHNMGSAHDRATSTYTDENNNGPCGNTTTPCLHYGRYPYSFGQKTGVTGGDFFTVMAYGDSGQNEYRVFSNPRITVCMSWPCGIENEADNARSLTQTSPVIAAFRGRIVPLHMHNDANGDRKSDLLWRDGGTLLDQWFMDGEKVVYSYAQSMDASWSVLGTGDLTADGRVDIVWSNGAELRLWASDGYGGYFNNLIRAYPSGWKFAGIGDIDGDGKSDLLWRDNADTRIAYWIMDGTTLVRSSVGSMGAAWRLGTSADLNGDGKLDLVWASSTSLLLWTGNGSTFSSATIRAYPAGWALAGAADINGDGKSDLLWRDNAKTKFTYWIMSGPSLVRTGTSAVGNTWNIGSFGDLNADARADIVWTNGSQLVLWAGNGNTFTNRVIGPAPAGSTMLR